MGGCRIATRLSDLSELNARARESFSDGGLRQGIEPDRQEPVPSVFPERNVIPSPYWMMKPTIYAECLHPVFPDYRSIPRIRPRVAVRGDLLATSCLVPPGDRRCQPSPLDHGWAVHRDVYRRMPAISFFESAKTRFQFHYRYLAGSHSASTRATPATRFD
jgi:hypothetical protein